MQFWNQITILLYKHNLSWFFISDNWISNYSMVPNKNFIIEPFKSVSSQPLQLISILQTVILPPVSALDEFTVWEKLVFSYNRSAFSRELHWLPNCLFFFFHSRLTHISNKWKVVFLTSRRSQILTPYWIRQPWRSNFDIPSARMRQAWFLSIWRNHQVFLIPNTQRWRKNRMWAAGAGTE